MSHESRTHRTVLLVEDNPGDADLILENLSQSGNHCYEVVKSGNLATALRQLETDSIDAVLLDLHLPDGSGVTCVEAIRSHSPDIPIVVLTGADDEELALACLTAGAQDYVSKHDAHPQGLSRAISYAIVRMHEISQRRRADAFAQRLVAIVDASADAIISMSLDGIVTSWNRGAEHIFGLLRNEVIGKSIVGIFCQGGGDEAPFIRGRLARTGQHSQTPEEVEWRRKDGRTVALSLVWCSLQNPQGDVSALAAICRDITESKYRESEARRHSAELLEHTQHMHELTTRLNALREEEHARISIEVHDEVGRLLSELKRDLQSMAGPSMPDPWVVERLVSTMALVDRTIAAVERIATDLGTGATRDQELKATRDQLVQTEKLASIGQLAAGVAHEINNPISYVASNFNALDDYLKRILQILDASEKFESTVGVASADMRKLRNDLQIKAIRDDLPKLVSGSIEGINRVQKIVRDLKNFSRVDTNQEWILADLHHCIDSTLNIISNEIKYKAVVIKEYGNIPDIECLPTELNQVFLNLLMNAVHAIKDQPGAIVIRTQRNDSDVCIEISDNGCGIAKENINMIFDPFYTTKPVGQGTGLGLSISYGIIRKHRGKIEVQSKNGQGTIFRLTIPIQHSNSIQVPE